jgi:hypothetical protein
MRVSSQVCLLDKTGRLGPFGWRQDAGEGPGGKAGTIPPGMTRDAVKRRASHVVNRCKPGRFFNPWKIQLGPLSDAATLPAEGMARVIDHGEPQG